MKAHLGRKKAKVWWGKLVQQQLLQQQQMGCLQHWDKKGGDGWVGCCVGGEGC